MSITTALTTVGTPVAGNYMGTPFVGTVGEMTRWHTLRPSLEVSVELPDGWTYNGQPRQRVIVSVDPATGDCWPDRFADGSCVHPTTTEG